MPKLKKGPLSLYYQLERILRDRILSEEIGPDEQMPTEASLCEEFGVSRATIRQAFKAMEDDGLIKREQGRGTFALPRDRELHLVKLYGSFDDMLLAGQGSELELKSKKLVVPEVDIARDMNLAEKEQVYLFEGIRFLPWLDTFTYLKFYAPRVFGKHISLKDELKPPFFIRRVEQIASETSRRIRQMVRAGIADAALATAVHVEPMEPLLIVKRIYFTKDDRVLMAAVSYVSGSAFELDHELILARP